MEYIIGFVVGVFVGAILGIVVISLCIAAKRGDELDAELAARMRNAIPRSPD